MTCGRLGMTWQEVRDDVWQAWNDMAGGGNDGEGFPMWRQPTPQEEMELQRRTTRQRPLKPSPLAKRQSILRHGPREASDLQSRLFVVPILPIDHQATTSVRYDDPVLLVDVDAQGSSEPQQMARWAVVVVQPPHILGIPL